MNRDAELYIGRIARATGLGYDVVREIIAYAADYDKADAADSKYHRAAFAGRVIGVMDTLGCAGASTSDIRGAIDAINGGRP